MEKNITNEQLNKYKNKFNKKAKNKILQNAITKNGIINASYNTFEVSKLQNIFNVEVKDMVSVTNQKQSGRCWMFASLNIIRPIIAKNLGTKDIDLSFTYLFFYDKLEKANNLLNLAIENIDKELDSREIESLISNGPEADGGWWCNFKALIEKYGIVPINASPEVYSSTNSSELDNVLFTLLTKDIYILKQNYNNKKDKEYLYTLKDDFLNEVYKILSLSLGTPVDKFKFDYKQDLNEKEPKIKHIKSTPIEFYNTYLKKDLNDYIILVNYPTDKYPYYQKYQNKSALTMTDSSYYAINLPIEELKFAAINSLKDNNPMWFAADVSQMSLRKDGILSLKAYDLEKLFDINFKYDKYQRCKMHASTCSHAMTLTGVNIEKNGKPSRWKVQNSWGTENGFNGIYIMSDDWFNEYLYEIVVDKKYLSEKVLKVLEDENIVDVDIFDCLA